MRVLASGMRESTMRFDARPGGAAMGRVGVLGTAGAQEGAVDCAGDEVGDGGGDPIAVSREEVVGVGRLVTRAGHFDVESFFRHDIRVSSLFSEESTSPAADFLTMAPSWTSKWCSR